MNHVIEGTFFFIRILEFGVTHRISTAAKTYTNEDDIDADMQPLPIPASLDPATHLVILSFSPASSSISSFTSSKHLLPPPMTTVSPLTGFASLSLMYVACDGRSSCCCCFEARRIFFTENGYSMDFFVYAQHRRSYSEVDIRDPHAKGIF